MSAPKEEVIAFAVAERQPPWRMGFQWRIWGKGTDFYVKARNPFTDEFKVSLHGPNERYDTWGFKFDVDGATRDAQRAGLPLNPGVNTKPIWFSGQDVGAGCLRLMRIAVPADMFTDGAPLPSDVKPVKASTVKRAGSVRAPEPGHYSALDLYLTENYDWPGRARLEQQDAILGTISNVAGHWLTGVSLVLNESEAPIPAVLRSFDAQPGEPTARAVSQTIDERGFLWLCERPAPLPRG